MSENGILKISIPLIMGNSSRLKTIVTIHDIPEYRARDLFAEFKAENSHLAGLVAKWETRRVVRI